MTRWLLVTAIILLSAVLVSIINRTFLDVRLDQIDARITRLQARLDPVRPVDVLCGISEQVQVLAMAVTNHCQLVHDVSIAPVPFPTQCRYPPPWTAEDK